MTEGDSDESAIVATVATTDDECANSHTGPLYSHMLCVCRVCTASTISRPAQGLAILGRAEITARLRLLYVQHLCSLY